MSHYIATHAVDWDWAGHGVEDGTPIVLMLGWDGHYQYVESCESYRHAQDTAASYNEQAKEVRG